MYRLTEQERKDIKETISVIVDDLKGFLESSGQDHVIVYNIAIKYLLAKDGQNIWDLYISQDQVLISSNSQSFELNGNYVYDNLYKEGIFLKFIYSYDCIREEVKKYCREKYGFKNEYLEEMYRIKEKYVRQKDIELDLPPATSRYKLEVTEEGGKKIGTIDFDDKIVRIVTSGDIVLVAPEKADKNPQKLKF